ncbi:hypothetical protein [Nocardia arthritidis]|uniref:Uncharacterized protein n=1 Tax=Nocardia arthritidis TaxID=228602 RepID=A0A6G9YJ30_9NOCA|nr:hypothetical protein [Nocardia arthritidis]QIS13201.1 hypothetical protein F5544_26735 [Nocardia arthritidis]
MIDAIDPMASSCDPMIAMTTIKTKTPTTSPVAIRMLLIRDHVVADSSSDSTTSSHAHITAHRSDTAAFFGYSTHTVSRTVY